MQVSIIIINYLGKPKIVFSTYESLSYKTCIEIYDENGNSKLITLWGKSYAKLSEFWMCKQTDCNISNKLREYIDKISLIEIPHEKFVESIKKTYNLKEIKMMLSRQEVDKFGLTFVNLTGFDIDVETPNFIKIKCSMCKYEVINGHCSLSCNMEDNRDTVKTFMLPISISDETGSFTNGVFLSDYIMLNILKCQAKDFEGLKNTIKTKIKWKYLFERCKLYFKIIQTQNQVKLKVLEFELDE
ncbi:Meiosis-specific with OB domain-containing protein [Intoshia linei]|uniref:Meiosis-specific with OB domain-containing protein n=1 Tax=Intoshia linei TaxID=1819745 RepID=A0A177B5G2_9BILA|nr:Meiosis-specific with OB domain-containing protein [Intoshia linei]